MTKSIYQSLGFTMLELLLSITIIAILSGLAIPIYQSFKVRNDLNIAAETLAQNLRRAQNLSRGMEQDSNWGVYITTGTITLFKGTSYASRQAAYDEDFPIIDIISSTGLDEIVFDKLTGEPRSIGTVTLTLFAGQSRDVVINEKGMVEY